MQTKLDLRKPLAKLTQDLSAFQKKQVPFAAAKALTMTAKAAQAVERAALPSVFDRPTPFTLNSIAITPATKANLTAIVFVKDIAAAYLMPFEVGGVHALGAKKALFTPIGQATNQYGNLPRTTLARLLAKPNVFYGQVQTKSGKTISGIWQRPAPTKIAAKLKRVKPGKAAAVTPTKPRGGLKLLIEFTPPKPVTQQLHFRVRAIKAASKTFPIEFKKALATALASAK